MSLKSVPLTKEQETEQYIFSLNPVLYVPLWKRDGGVFISDDAHGYVCTATGATRGLQGRLFDIAHDDYISIPDHVSLDGFTSGMTIETWVKRSEAGVLHNLVRKSETTDNQRSYGIYIGTDNKVVFYVCQLGTDTSNSSTTTGTITDANFHHIVGVWLPSQHPIIYIDNALQAVTTAGTVKTAIFAGTAPLYLGYTASSLYGVMGEARIYNRGFNAPEVTNDFLTTSWRYR
jgi:hypothetical protein